MKTIQIKTNVFLHLLEPRFAEELFEAVDRNRDRLREWMPWVDATQGPEDTLSFIQSTIAGQSKGECQYAILQDNQIIGVIGYNHTDTANKSSMIGYWLDQQAEGQGIITLAVQAFLKLGFNELGLNRIVIRAQPTNTRSCAVPERLGFTAEGLEQEAEFLYDRFVDLKIYALLRRNWEKQS